MSCCSSSCNATKGTWNDLEEMKYLLCAIECCKCPSVLPPPTCSVVLPPRIEELCPVIPPQRPCCPPPRCPPTPCYPQSRPCPPPSPPCCAPSPPRCSPSPLCCKIPIVPSPACFPPPICAPLPSRSCCLPSPLPSYPKNRKMVKEFRTVNADKVLCFNVKKNKSIEEAVKCIRRWQFLYELQNKKSGKNCETIV